MVSREVKQDNGYRRDCKVCSGKRTVRFLWTTMGGIRDQQWYECQKCGYVCGRTGVAMESDLAFRDDIRLLASEASFRQAKRGSPDRKTR